MLIFGSTALKYWLPDLKRSPKDLDLIGAGQNSKNIEYHSCPSFQYILKNNKDQKYVDLNFLYTIKCSHLNYDINWDKHCLDVMLMQSKDVKIDNFLFDSLMNDWQEIHGKKKLNLNQSSNNFFTNYVKREMDHDKLHDLFAYYGEPMFKKILKDGCDVFTDISKWNKLSHEEKLICILEESYVTAFERWNLPPKLLKMKGIKLYCTSLSKNEYFKYAVINMKALYDHSANSFFQNKILSLR